MLDYLIRMGFIFAGVIAIAFLISKAFEEERPSLYGWQNEKLYYRKLA